MPPPDERDPRLTDQDVTESISGGDECAGQGGCGHTEHEAEQTMVGAQHCCWSNGCASPIDESRGHAAGSYHGISVWQRARKVFEQRMFEAWVPPVPAPAEGRPDDLAPDDAQPRPATKPAP